MSGWLLDTNVIAELMGPACDDNVAAWIASRAEDELFISVLTLAEIVQGIASLPENDLRRPRFKAQLSAVESRFGQRVLPVDAAVAKCYGEIVGTLRRTGRKPPVIDTLLAATAIEHGLTLVTRNIKDVAATGVLVLDPWQSARSKPSPA